MMKSADQAHGYDGYADFGKSFLGNHGKSFWEIMFLFFGILHFSIFLDTSMLEFIETIQPPQHFTWHYT
jgi:hypothetical protein